MHCPFPQAMPQTSYLVSCLMISFIAHSIYPRLPGSLCSAYYLCYPAAHEELSGVQVPYCGEHVGGTNDSIQLNVWDQIYVCSVHICNNGNGQ